MGLTHASSPSQPPPSVYPPLCSYPSLNALPLSIFHNVLMIIERVEATKGPVNKVNITHHLSYPQGYFLDILPTFFSPPSFFFPNTESGTFLCQLLHWLPGCPSLDIVLLPCHISAA